PREEAKQCPPDMAHVGPYCVDRFEAHLAVRDSSGAFVVHPPHQRPSGGERYFARSQGNVRPQAYISRVESAAACQNSGKRLCSVEEWFRACRGSQKTIYPYGRKFERGRCNVGKAHLLSRFFGTDARQWEYAAHFNNPMLSQQPGFLANTGEYQGCVNDYGLHDMVGNIQEWVADRPDPSLAFKLPLQDGIRRSLGSGAGKGIFMGGFYSTTNEHGRGCAFLTAAHEVKYHDYSTGFRCCRDATDTRSPQQ
ncbi:MAG TPA: SUMF1/EgtB/PvdO family nonheme iron enzyme, partial [Polyangiaceae bacterium]